MSAQINNSQIVQIGLAFFHDFAKERAQLPCRRQQFARELRVERPRCAVWRTNWRTNTTDLFFLSCHGV